MQKINLRYSTKLIF